ncbi:MAG: cytochrome c [Chloroflexi bacterium]|nr:cytochrome c [Chloroflexota bacterium]
MRFSLIILLFALVLTACGGMAGIETAVSDRTQAPGSGERAGRGMGMGMGMGMGNGMMARHRATVPEEYAGLTNPIPADEESLARGEEIYTTYCVVCHGEGGMGDGANAANLDPAPAPIAHTSRMLGDDYLYWRVSEGGSHDPFNSAMPAWGTAFDETDRWDVINYIRALSSGQVMPGGMGSRFDPAAEGQQRAEMLKTAVADGVLTQAEADTFDTVHGLMEDPMAGEAPMSGSMGQNQIVMLTALLEAGKISQADADAFNEIHDRLLESGLMQ